MKNKKVKVVLDTVIDDSVVNKGLDLIGERFKQKDISNFEIEKVFKETNNDDLNKDFLGVFPSDKISKFVMFEKMMPGKKYPFII